MDDNSGPDLLLDGYILYCAPPWPSKLAALSLWLKVICLTYLPVAWSHPRRWPNVWLRLESHLLVLHHRRRCLFSRVLFSFQWYLQEGKKFDISSHFETTATGEMWEATAGSGIEERGRSRRCDEQLDRRRWTRRSQNHASRRQSVQTYLSCPSSLEQRGHPHCDW